MKKILLIALGAVSLLLGSCTKDNGGGESGPVAVQSVSLNKPATSILEGATETLTAVVAPATAANQKVTWTSSDAAIATVSDAGLVTAVKAGTATITVTSVADNTKTATCVVTVSPIAVTGVSVDRTAATISVGAATTLNATVLPANAANKAVTWTSSDVAIATVSDAGLVTAVKEGAATITVTTQDGNKTATCTVMAVVVVVFGDLSWAVGNLVADGANGCKIGAPTDGGLYFHFGSLVGWQGGAWGDGTGVTNPSRGRAVQVKPVGYTGSITWPAGYYKDGATSDWAWGYTGPTTDAPTTGIGDPCRYYLGAPWRTPTLAEYDKLIGGGGASNTNQDVPLKINGSALVFPASGYWVESFVDSHNIYWSSSVSKTNTSSDESTGTTFSFGKFGKDVSAGASTPRMAGCPVRCVASAR